MRTKSHSRLAGLLFLPYKVYVFSKPLRRRTVFAAFVVDKSSGAYRGFITRYQQLGFVTIRALGAISWLTGNFVLHAPSPPLVPGTCRWCVENKTYVLDLQHRRGVSAKHSDSRAKHDVTRTTTKEKEEYSRPIDCTEGGGYMYGKWLSPRRLVRNRYVVCE
jgi:hypothetical protein